MSVGRATGGWAPSFWPDATEGLLNAFLATDQQASSLPITYNEYDEKADAPWSKKTSISARRFPQAATQSQPMPPGKNRSSRPRSSSRPPSEARRTSRNGCAAAACSNSRTSTRAAAMAWTPAIFVVDRGLLFDADKLSQAKFEHYIESQAQRFCRRGTSMGKAWEFRLGQPLHEGLNLPPYPLAYRARLYVASEITRGDPGWWDSFWVTFQPGAADRHREDRICGRGHGGSPQGQQEVVRQQQSARRHVFHSGARPFEGGRGDGRDREVFRAPGSRVVFRPAGQAMRPRSICSVCNARSGCPLKGSDMYQGQIKVIVALIILGGHFLVFFCGLLLGVFGPLLGSDAVRQCLWRARCWASPPRPR